MKIGFLCYSLTGNTLYVAKRVGEVLCQKLGLTADKDILIVDLVAAFRAESPSNPISLPIEQLSSCDVIGLGCLSWAWREPPGMLSTLKKALPQGMFKGKPSFVFCTKGAVQVIAHMNMAGFLRKHLGARVLAQFSVAAPSNFAPMTPKIPLARK